MAEDKTNPWVRADLEKYNIETLALIPEGRRFEYGKVMHELAHWKFVVIQAMDMLNQAEANRHEFFAEFIANEQAEVIEPPLPDNVVSLR